VLPRNAAKESFPLNLETPGGHAGTNPTVAECPSHSCPPRTSHPAHLMQENRDTTRIPYTAAERTAFRQPPVSHAQNTPLTQAAGWDDYTPIRGGQAALQVGIAVDSPSAQRHQRMTPLATAGTRAQPGTAECRGPGGQDFQGPIRSSRRRCWRAAAASKPRPRATSRSATIVRCATGLWSSYLNLARTCVTCRRKPRIPDSIRP